MSRSDSLRRELTRIIDREASVQAEIAKYLAEANKNSAEAAKKAEAAMKTKSLSSQRSYLGQATTYRKKAADAEKKLADARKRFARLGSDRVGKQRDLERSEKSDREKLLRDVAKERQADLAHAKRVASIQRSAQAVRTQRPDTLRVLYLTTNPGAFDSDYALRTDVEIRNVQNEISRTRYRDRIEIKHLPAATYDDMLRGLNDYRPHVVHFSGHGGAGGLEFDNASIDSPGGVGVGFSSLRDFLRATDEPPRLIVLNACDTLEGAEVLLEAVSAVIAMSDVISDLAASVFATQFYSAIASAQSVGSALKQGKAMLAMMPSVDDHLPQCIVQLEFDIDEWVLIDPTQ